MLIVGSVSSREERYELHNIAEICTVGQRIRCLSNQNKKDEKR